MLVALLHALRFDGRMTATRITVTLEEAVAAELRDKVPAGEVSGFVLAAGRCSAYVAHS